MGVDAERCPVMLVLQVVENLLRESVYMRGYSWGGNRALKERLESGQRKARGRRGGGYGNFHYVVLPLVVGTRSGSREFLLSSIDKGCATK